MFSAKICYFLATKWGLWLKNIHNAPQHTMALKVPREGDRVQKGDSTHPRVRRKDESWSTWRIWLPYQISDRAWITEDSKQQRTEQVLPRYRRHLRKDNRMLGSSHKRTPISQLPRSCPSKKQGHVQRAGSTHLPETKKVKLWSEHVGESQIWGPLRLIE